MSLPFPSEERVGDGKPFAVRRATLRQGAQRLANLIVAFLNFLFLGCPLYPPKGDWWLQSPNDLQTDFGRQVFLDARRFCAASGGDFPPLGGGRAKLVGPARCQNVR